MFKHLGNKRLFVLLVSFILFFALMGFTLGHRAQPTWAEMFVKDVVSYTQGWFYKPAGYMAGFFKDIRELKILYAENKALKQTLAFYANDTLRLNELEEQNERLKTALNFTERQKRANDYTFHIAEVTGYSSDPPYNDTLVVNLGEKDEMKVNMAVVTTEGLVGRVVWVSEFYSNVQLIKDIQANLTSTKAIAATVRGKEDDYANPPFGMIESYVEETGMLVMTKIDETDSIAVGDLVVTSGLGGVYPKGLIIGTVESKSVGDFGLTQSAMVKPAASFNRLREVFLVEVPGE